MSSHEILHQSSCTYTPQQKRVVECKNRYLVETTRTLLLHHLFYRIESFIPSFFQTNPFSAFLLVSLVVSVLFIFLLLDKTSSQTKPRSVFLGYSRLQRGYCCYSPDTHRYFVFANVTFFENSSTFPTTLPPRSDVISLPLLYLVSDTSSVPPATPPRPLQVYTHRMCTSASG